MGRRRRSRSSSCRSAASLFGAFEIALPASLNNRLSGVGGAGYRGAFVLGLVCGLVAAPCVGPFLFGLLGWIATTRNVALGSAAMALYGLGLGTLFFVVGAFAVNLPKAGAWMMGIKWVGGVCLAYMALAYVRDALPKETSHDVAAPRLALRRRRRRCSWRRASGWRRCTSRPSGASRRIAHLSKPTKLASIVPAIAGLFMVATWWQTPGGALMSDAIVATRRRRRGRSGPLKWETSEAAARARATSEHKPLLVDFGASWCGACKELDEKTFPDPRVRAEGARFVALHVDATDDDDPEVARVRRSTASPRACRWCCSSAATAPRPSASRSSSRPSASPAPSPRSAERETARTPEERQGAKRRDFAGERVCSLGDPGGSRSPGRFFSRRRPFAPKVSGVASSAA